jgi:hypothetical protein
MASLKASKRSMSSAKPAAWAWPPQRSRCVRGGAQSAHRGDPRRRADAALAPRHDEHRSVEALDQVARDEAHHARMPTRIGDHDGRRGGVDLRQGALEHGVLDALAFAVVLVEAGRDLARTRLRGRRQELEAQIGLAEPPGGVEARRQAEGDVACGGCVGEPSERQRRAHARPGGGAHPLEAHLDQRAVLPQQRRHVGDRADRGEVGVRQRVVEAEATMDGPQQVVGDAGARQLGQPATGGRRPSGVHDQAVGQTFARRVVVADDDLDTGRLQRLDLGQVADAAVDGEQQVGPGRVLGHAVGMDAVAVAEAVRDERRDLRAQRAEAQGEHGRPGDPVGVVVAVDADAPAALDGVDQAVGGGAEVGDGGQGQGRVEPFGGVVAPAPGPQHGRQLGMDVEEGREAGHRGGRRGRTHPPLDLGRDRRPRLRPHRGRVGGTHR